MTHELRYISDSFSQTPSRETDWEIFSDRRKGVFQRQFSYEYSKLKSKLSLWNSTLTANSRWGDIVCWDDFWNFVNVPEFYPWDLPLVPGNNTVLIVNPMKILVRLGRNWKKLETISRFCATPLSAISCSSELTFVTDCGTFCKLSCVVIVYTYIFVFTYRNSEKSACYSMYIESRLCSQCM